MGEQLQSRQNGSNLIQLDGTKFFDYALNLFQIFSKNNFWSTYHVICNPVYLWANYSWDEGWSRKIKGLVRYTLYTYILHLGDFTVFAIL